jgi:hypothetical protein
MSILVTPTLAHYLVLGAILFAIAMAAFSSTVATSSSC